MDSQSNSYFAMKSKIVFSALFWLLSIAFAHSATYYWHGTTSTNWATASNWSTSSTVAGTGSAVPLSTDTVILLSRTNLPILDSNRTIAVFTITSGTLNLNTFTLTITGAATFTAGAVNNGTVTKTSTATVIFGDASGGPTIGANIDLKAGTLTIRNTTFNGTTTLEKTGTSSDANTGNNTFNGLTTLTKSGTTGVWNFANVTRDIFNNDVTFTNTGTSAIQVAFNNDINGATQFNGNLTLNNTNTGGITFGQGTIVTSSITGGTSTLAIGKTLAIGTSGFVSTGALNMRNFTQLGTGTTHTIALTGTTNLFTLTSCTFNGTVDFKAPQMVLATNTFNGTATFEKSGASNNNSIGNNTFNGITTIKNSGSAIVTFANTTRDIFNNDLTLSASNSGGFQMAFNNANSTDGTLFNGNLTLNNTGTGSITFGMGTTVNGSVTGGTSALASGKVLSIGSSGYILSGALTLRNFTQVGSGTTHTIALTGTTNLFTLTSCTFNGTVNFKAPQMVLATNTFNGTSTFEKTGAGNNNSTGNNTFNGITAITNSGTGYFLFSNTTRDIFNATVTLTASSSGIVYLAQNDDANGATQFNGNISIKITGTGSVRFGQGATVTNGITGGTSVLASGKTISFDNTTTNTSGAFYLKNFTQLGNTSQTINAEQIPFILSGGNTFNGSLSLVTKGATISGTNSFNGDFSLTLSSYGTGTSSFIGTVTYGGNVTITNSSSGSFNITYSATYPATTAFVSQPGRFVIAGGSTYTGTTTFIAGTTVSSGSIYTNGVDTYNGKVFISGTGSIRFCDAATSISYLNEDIEISGASTGHRVGYANGVTYLANGKRILIGPDGWTGNIRFNNLIQYGTTPMSLTIADSALLNFSNCTINAPITLTSGLIGFSSCTVNNSIVANLTDFSGLPFNFTSLSTFNENVDITISGNVLCQINKSSIFNKDLAIKVTDGRLTFFSDNTSTLNTQFNGNVTVSCTNPNGGVYFSDATSFETIQLATDKTISVGSSGFSAGQLYIGKFAQNGTTAQNIALTGTASLVLDNSTTWNGPVTFSAPSISAAGSTFNNTASLETTGAIDTNWGGGNTFNAAATIKNSGTGAAYLANTTGDTFNDNIAFIRTGTGGLFPSYNAASSFTKNISVAGSTSPVQFATGATGSLTLNGTTAQSINNGATDARPEFGNLVINNTSGVTVNSDVLVSGSLNLQSGTLAMAASKILTYSGVSPTLTSGNLDVSNSNTIDFASASNLSLPANLFSGNVTNLTVSTTPVVTLGSDVTVSGVLSLSDKQIATGTNKVILNTGANLSRTSGWVNGNLQKNVTIGTSTRTFEVGDASVYTPVSLALSGVTTAGTIVVKTTGTDHPAVASSLIDATKHLNRYYSISNNGVVGATYSPIFTFTASDVTSGNTAIFVAQRYDGANWFPTKNGAKTSSTTQALNLTAFGDFQVGEKRSIATTAQASTTTVIGTTESNAVISIYSGSTLLGTTIADASGAYIFNLSPARANGTLLTITAADSASNILSGTSTTIINPIGGTVSGNSCTSTTNFVLSGYVGSITKWQSSTSSNFSTNVTDIITTASSLSVRGITTTTYYRAVVAVSTTSVYSSSAVVNTRATSLVIGSITGSTDLCGLSTAIFTVPATIADALSGNTNYIWTMPSGLAISSSTGNQVVVNVSSAMDFGTITVKKTNTCGTSSTASIVVARKPTITNISGPTSTCGISTATYSAVCGSANTTFAWTVPPGMSISSGQGSSTITVDINSSFSTGGVRVSVTNTCGTSDVKRLSVAAITTAGTINGPSQVCNLTSASYTVAQILGASYTWTVPAGISIISGQGTTNLVVGIDNSFTVGSIGLATTSTCGTSSQELLEITTNKTPKAISGPSVICGMSQSTYNSDGVLITSVQGQGTYNVASVSGATSYTWTVPTGATIVSGQGTTSIVVNYDLATFANGIISIVSNSNCGVSGTSSLNIVNIRTVLTGPAQICGLSTATYSVPSSVGSGFSWSVPSFMNITSGQGTNSINVSFNSTVVCQASAVSVRFTSNCNTNETASLSVGCSDFTKINESFANSIISTIDTKIYAISAVTSMYKFRITSGSLVQYYESPQNYFRLTSLATWDYQTTYSVDVAIKVNGIYKDYGCPVTLISPNLPLTKLSDVFCNGLAKSADRVYANGVIGATFYKFRVTNGSFVQEIERPVAYFKMFQITGLAAGVTYSVDVATKTASGVYSSYGSVCFLNYDLALTSKLTTGQTDWDVQTNENPYNDSFNLMLNVIDETSVEVSIFEVSGKQVQQISIPSVQLSTTPLGSNLASGMYIVKVIQGAHSATLRVLKK